MWPLACLGSFWRWVRWEAVRGLALTGGLGRPPKRALEGQEGSTRARQTVRARAGLASRERPGPISMLGARRGGSVDRRPGPCQCLSSLPSLSGLSKEAQHAVFRNVNLQSGWGGELGELGGKSEECPTHFARLSLARASVPETLCACVRAAVSQSSQYGR